MKYWFLSLYLIQAVGLCHTPPPIDVTNASGGGSHSGYGYYGNDDYEGFLKLRKSCTEDNRADGYKLFQTHCVGPSKPLRSIDQNQFKVLAQNMVNGRFIDKILVNVIDEIKLIDPGFVPASNCLEATVNSKPASHQDLRKEAMALKNALSASLLSTIHTKLRDRQSDSGSNYLERLEINYPYLYKPTSRFEELSTIIKNNLGSAYDDDPNQTTSHSETISALNAKMVTDSRLRSLLQSKLDEIKSGYANYLKENINNFCSNNELYNARKNNSEAMKFMHRNFRRDFQQNLIDLGPSERAMANEYLCAQNFYYRPGIFDSDCDGLEDSSDVSPNDPFSPRANFQANYNDGLNPPFGGEVNYSAKLENNKVIVTKSIQIAVGPTASSNDKRQLLNKANICIQQLQDSMKASFDKFKASPGGAAYSNREFQLSFEVSTTTSSNPDFFVHNCWCSTCDMKYIPPGRQDSVPIPKNICEEDFTPEMRSAMNNRVINPTENSRRWMKQEDAQNLTNESLGERNCRTVKHEFMHKLGLPDEYHNEGYYPFNQVGDRTSLMSGGDEIFSRHFVNLLSPKACERRTENYGY